MTFTTGSRVGAYDIVGLLGKGGMGEVYRAHDRKLERDVALKTLPAEFVRDSERLARFDREAKVLASLNHPHIAAIYGLEESGDARLLVLELVEGETLAERIRREPVPVEESIRLAIQIVQALETAHEKGVVHRDLKLANIKVTPEGDVKVLDFGLAKALAEHPADPSLTNSPTMTMSMAATAQGFILGTAAYMSPEQAKGRAANRRTDLWAFGCVLYEMLTGRPAFAGETITDILASVVARDPDWSLLPLNIHPRLGELLRRCLEKNSKKRWHDAGDIRVELESILEDPTGMRARSAAVPVPSKLRVLMPWAVAAVFAIVAAGAWVLKTSPVTEPRFVTRFDYPLPDTQAFRNEGRNVVALSPDGRHFVYNVSGGLYLRSMDTLDAHSIPGTTEALTNPFFSPDSQWVGYFQDSQLKKIPLSGGAPVVLCEAENLFGASWEADGTILFGQTDGIWRVSANGGMREQIVRAEAEAVDGPQMLPGGEWVLFSVTRGAEVTRWDTAEIVAQSLRSGERKVLWRGGSGARYVPTGHLVYATGNVLFAVPFDPDRLEVTGGPMSLVEGVRRANLFAGTTQTGTANYGISLTGTLLYGDGEGRETAAPVGVPAFVDRNGQIQRLNLPANEYRSPRLSPDGRQIAMEIVDAGRRSAVWLYDLSGATQTRRLTQEGNGIHPIWTPDSRRITFASDRDGAWGIYWQPADGSGMAERLTTAEAGAQQSPESWSPDGSVLGFVNQRRAGDTGTQELWTFSLERRAAELFYDGPLTDNGMAFSPNGKLIAYSSDAGVMSIFVEPFPRVPGVRYQVTATSETHPLWSPNGKELFYRVSATAGRPAVHRVEVRTESPFTFTNEETLPLPGFLTFANYTSYDITPDGERVLVVLPADQPTTTPTARPRIHIVENWFEELKRVR